MQLPKKSSQCTEESVSGIKKKVNKSDEGSLAIKGGGKNGWAVYPPGKWLYSDTFPEKAYHIASLRGGGGLII